MLVVVVVVFGRLGAMGGGEKGRAVVMLRDVGKEEKVCKLEGVGQRRERT